MPEETQRFVLVVEDDEFVRLIFERVFARHPEYLLDVASSVALAIEKIRAAWFDLIFLDMHFDGDHYAGMEVLRELDRIVIRQQSDWKGVLNSRVIIMSSTIELGRVMAEANALGVLEFMAKPIPFDEVFLTRVLRRVGLPIMPPRST